jgi:hypothetical protein
MEKTNNVEEIDEVLDIYKKAIASIKNSQAINEETLKVAEGIGQKLAAQTEQMLTIQSKLDQLGDGLGRAKHEMNTFLKGLATEKVKKKKTKTHRSPLSLLFVLFSFC